MYKYKENKANQKSRKQEFLELSQTTKYRATYFYITELQKLLVISPATQKLPGL